MERCITMLARMSFLALGIFVIFVLMAILNDVAISNQQYFEKMLIPFAIAMLCMEIEFGHRNKAELKFSHGILLFIFLLFTVLTLGSLALCVYHFKDTQLFIIPITTFIFQCVSLKLFEIIPDIEASGKKRKNGLLTKIYRWLKATDKIPEYLKGYYSS